MEVSGTALSICENAEKRHLLQKMLEDRASDLEIAGLALYQPPDAGAAKHPVDERYPTCPWLLEQVSTKRPTRRSSRSFDQLPSLRDITQTNSATKVPTASSGHDLVQRCLRHTSQP